MKQDTTLFIFALVLAFLTGNISYLIKSNQKVDLNDIKLLNEINRDLQNDYSPLLRLDLNSEYPTTSHLSLLKRAGNHLSRPHSLGLQTREKIKPSSSDCAQNKFQKRISEFVNKETLWLSFLCQQINLLPKDFFEISPFLHANGHSYAYMYYQLLPKSTKKQIWYQKYAKYMHLKELKIISWPLNQSSQFLYTVKQEIIDRILKNEKVILSEDFYLLRTGNLKYFILDAQKAHTYFNRVGFNLTNDPKGCFIAIGNVCWKKRPHNIISFLSQSSIIVFVVTVFIFFLTANTLYSRIKMQKIEEERKKHALRVLTHELRTPVASLLLQINDLGAKTQNLPSDVTENILSIENDIYRLKRLAEKSKSYLQTNSGQEINYHKSLFSIQEFCEEVASEYTQYDIQINIEKEFQIDTDQYWLKMCVTNLIENSIRYGKAPIMIKTQEDEKFRYIHIIDNGEIKHNSLKEILNAKHENSKGLGLGLLIIKKTLKFLGGELMFTPNPTTFSIKFKRS